MHRKPKGTLILIGGSEEKDPDEQRVILREVARRTGNKLMVIMPVATQYPEEVSERYASAFKELGVKHIECIDIRSRQEASDEAAQKIRHAAVVFFTGGDQLRLTSQLSDSPLYREIQHLYEEGGTIVGTSAGAAAMPETMIVGGRPDTNDISTLGMAPGLGLISGVAIDSHFAERGRFGRLLGVVAQNPKNLGLGINENTAVMITKEECFSVLGPGSVYVMDGAHISYSSLSEQHPEGTLSIFDVQLHVMADGDRFDLAARRPLPPVDSHQSSESSNGKGEH